MFNLKTRRIGRFKVDHHFYDTLDVEEGVNLFDRMVVLDVVHDHVSGVANYTAIHPSYRELPYGEIIPMYVPKFHLGCIAPEWIETKETY